MDWAELNADLLHVVSKKLDDFLSFSCFRGVCKNWRLATDPSDHPPSLPWFLQYNFKDPTSLEFFSLQSNKTHILNIPEQNLKQNLLGPSNRYIFTLDFCNLTASFLNPLIGTRIHVPEISPTYFQNIPRLLVINHDPTENGHVAIISGNAGREKRDMLVIFVRYDGTILTKRVEIEVEVEVSFVGAIAYYKGRLFSSAKEITRVIDVDSGNEVLALPEPKYGLGHLVEAFGDLFGVTRQLVAGNPEFEVYRLEGDGDNAHWTKMNNGIGDIMLFLDMGGGFALKASDYDGYRGNCIYFVRLIHTYANGNNFVQECSLSRYDITNNTVQVLPSSVNCGGWFVPSL